MELDDRGYHHRAASSDVASLHGLVPELEDGHRCVGHHRQHWNHGAIVVPDSGEEDHGRPEHGGGSHEEIDGWRGGGGGPCASGQGQIGHAGGWVVAPQPAGLVGRMEGVMAKTTGV